MKTLFKISCLILFISFSSCGTEEITVDDNTINQQELESREVDLTSNTDVNSLENKMQWVAYITAQVLLKSENCRQQFYSAAINSELPDAIKLEDLLSENLEDLSFRNEFQEEFIYYNFSTVNPNCDGVRQPKGRPTVRPPGGMPIHAIFDGYVFSLLNEDCLEIYLPNDISGLLDNQSQDEQISQIISTAHPLDNSISNEGFKHNTKCSVGIITVEASTYGSTLVVRPYRTTTDCLYNEYAIVEDFEDFLE